MINKPLIIISACAVLIIAVAAFVYFDESYATTLVTNDNAVLIEDQKPSDTTTVTYAKLSKPGYVIVYATDTSGEKTVLGQSVLLSAGEHRNVPVRHTDGGHTKAGSEITASIVADNGDGIFDENTDTAVLVPEEEAPAAEISEEAVLDPTPTDEELQDLLDEAGYEVTDDASDEESVTPEEATDGTTPDEAEAEDTTASSTETIQEDTTTGTDVE